MHNYSAVLSELSTSIIIRSEKIIKNFLYNIPIIQYQVYPIQLFQNIIEFKYTNSALRIRIKQNLRIIYGARNRI